MTGAIHGNKIMSVEKTILFQDSTLLQLPEKGGVSRIQRRGLNGIRDFAQLRVAGCSMDTIQVLQVGTNNRLITLLVEFKQRWIFQGEDRESGHQGIRERYLKASGLAMIRYPGKRLTYGLQ